MEPPPPPTRAEQAPPPPPQTPPKELRSGDDTGTAPAPRAEPADKVTPPPTEPAESQLEAELRELGDLPPPTHKPAPPRVVAIPAPQQPPKAPLSRAPGTGEGGGDPYVNAIYNKIISYKFYPSVARPLELEGSAQYEIILDRSGQLIRIGLLKSTGAGVLDDVGFTMIRRAAPFAPAPSYVPGNPIRLVLVLNISPRESEP